MPTTRAAIPPSAPPRPPARGWERYARLVAGRRSKWAVLAIWVVLIAVGGSLAAKIGSVQDNDPQTWLPTNAQSTKAMDVGEKHFADKNVSTAVVVYARESGLTDADLAKVAGDRTALTTKGAAAADVPVPVVADDHKAVFLSVPLRTSKNDNTVLGDGVHDLRDLARENAPSGLDVRITGQAGNIADFIDVYSGMDVALLGATLGLVALLLLITYRSPVLWLIPLVSVALGAQIANGVVYLLAKHAGLLVNGQSAYVLTVLVLGVGTDYALLLVARYREELRRHEDRHEAMTQALIRCLPAITASALTVIAATLCLVFGSMNSTRGLGPVVAIGVAVVSLAMTSLLPALLVILGRWTFWPFVPRYAPDAVASARGGGGLWAKVAHLVGRSPRLLWIGTALVLGALALGAGAIGTGQTQAEQFTKEVDSVGGQRLLAAHFPAGSAAPADVYVPSGGTATALSVLDGVPGVLSATVDRSAAGWTHLDVVLADAPDTRSARRTVQRMRATLDRAPGAAADAVVGGQSAVALDTSDAQGSEEKLLIPLVLGIVLIMLVVLLRALVAPIVLLLSVVLSYAAAVGAAVLVFRALDHPRIDRGLLLFGFLFLVALGIDYTVFLMTRAREEVRRQGHREGMLTALTVTGGVITSAGIVLAATFAVLTVIPTVTSLQQGLLVAIGVLLDTFLVRSLLVPALALDIGPRIWRPGRPEKQPDRTTRVRADHVRGAG
ncbi:MMPL family transporter [Embleya scabrispora]|uniref:MMPL family transporter n=1 Tax=Embleya scabrispora TaxID=159449 RepID=UPI000371E0EE|nr:MMPL family transporter [Embleya scabrispora]MYS84995.1 MMPL family transporter [Streptomyces sp. SID5474]